MSYSLIENNLETILIDYLNKAQNRYIDARNLKRTNKNEYEKLKKEHNVLLKFSIMNKKYYIIDEYIGLNNKRKVALTKKNTGSLPTIKTAKYTLKPTKITKQKNFFSIDYWFSRNKTSEKFALTNTKEYNTFRTAYTNEIKRIYDEVNKIGNKIKAETGSFPFIHMANNIIKKNKLKPRNYIYNISATNNITANPDGLWFSCNNNWYKHILIRDIDLIYAIETKKAGDLIEYKVHNEYHIWIPRFIYIIKTDKLKLYNIASCKDMKKFEKEYHNPNPKVELPYETIDWGKLYSEYNGLYICPYLGHDCYSKSAKDYMEKDKEYINDERDAVFMDILKGNKVTKTDYTGFWATNFEHASGVIWNGYKDLELQRIV